MRPSSRGIFGIAPRPLRPVPARSRRRNGKASPTRPRMLAEPADFARPQHWGDAAFFVVPWAAQGHLWREPRQPGRRTGAGNGQFARSRRSGHFRDAIRRAARRDRRRARVLLSQVSPMSGVTAAGEMGKERRTRSTKAAVGHPTSTRDGAVSHCLMVGWEQRSLPISGARPTASLNSESLRRASQSSASSWSLAFANIRNAPGVGTPYQRRGIASGPGRLVRRPGGSARAWRGDPNARPPSGRARQPTGCRRPPALLTPPDNRCRRRPTRP